MFLILLLIRLIRGRSSEVIFLKIEILFLTSKIFYCVSKFFSKAVTKQSCQFKNLVFSQFQIKSFVPGIYLFRIEPRAMLAEINLIVEAKIKFNKAVFIR